MGRCIMPIPDFGRLPTTRFQCFFVIPNNRSYGIVATNFERGGRCDEGDGRISGRGSGRD